MFKSLLKIELGNYKFEFKVGAIYKIFKFDLVLVAAF